MFLINDPGPWQDYTRKHPGKSIESLRQQYLAEQLMYFQSIEQIINQSKSQGASYSAPIAVTPPSLTIVFDNSYSFPVANASSVSLWNTLLGSSFTKSTVNAKTVVLTGGSSFSLLANSLGAFGAGTGVVSIVDTGRFVLGGADYCLGYNETLTNVNLPAATSFTGIRHFAGAGFNGTNITFNLPSCTQLGQTVLANSVFSDITGKVVTLTIPASLMTCNSGNPDGDIQVLQANNTVTIVTV